MKKQKCWYIGKGNQCIPEIATEARVNINGFWEYKSPNNNEWQDAPMLGEDSDKYEVPARFAPKIMGMNNNKLLISGLIIFIIGFIFLYLNTVQGDTIESIIDSLLISDWIISLLIIFSAIYLIAYILYRKI